MEKWRTIKHYDAYFRQHVYGYDDRGIALIGFWTPYGYFDIKDYRYRLEIGGNKGIHQAR